MAEVKWKKASTRVLVADILETYYWRAWTVDLMWEEVCRIRGSRVGKAQVKEAMKRLLKEGVAVKGYERMVRYNAYHKGGHPYRVITAKWRNDARNTA